EPPGSSNTPSTDTYSFATTLPTRSSSSASRAPGPGAASAVPGRLRVRVEPVGDAPRVLDAVARLSAAREVVVVLGKAYELRLDAVQAERGEELLGLLDRT